MVFTSAGRSASASLTRSPARYITAMSARLRMPVGARSEHPRSSSETSSALSGSAGYLWPLFDGGVLLLTISKYPSTADEGVGCGGQHEQAEHRHGRARNHDRCREAGRDVRQDQRDAHDRAEEDERDRGKVLVACPVLVPVP